MAECLGATDKGARMRETFTKHGGSWEYVRI